MGFQENRGQSPWHSLGTTDGLHASNTLSEWLKEIGQRDPATARDTTMGKMLVLFLATRAGQKPRNEVSIANLIRRGFKPGMGILLVRVKTSGLQTYLVEQAAKNE